MSSEAAQAFHSWQIERLAGGGVDYLLAATLYAEDVGDWAARMVALHRDLGIEILGGCCGTERAHLERLAVLIRS